MENTLDKLISKIVNQQNDERCNMIWHDIRKKLPEDEQSCLVTNENDELSILPQRAYFTDGYFLSLEQNNAFPMLVTHWMVLPKFED